MANDLQVSSQELSALLNLAWRAPKLPAEALWLQSLSDRVAALAAQSLQENQVNQEEEQHGQILGRI